MSVMMVAQALTMGGACAAQDDAPTGAPSAAQRAAHTPGFGGQVFAGGEPARLRLSVEPMLWYMGPAGELRMPAGVPSDTVDVDALGMDSPKIVPTLEIHVFGTRQAEGNWLERQGWRVGLRGFATGVDAQTLVGNDTQLGELSFPAGSTVRSALDYASVELEFGVPLHTHASETGIWTPEGAWVPDTSAHFEGVVGAQVLDVDWRVEGSGISQRAGAAGAGVLVGGRLAFSFGSEWHVDVSANVTRGVLGDEMVAGDVVVGGAWTPTPNFGLQIGYRSAFFGLKSEEAGASDFEYDGALQGLMFGCVIRF